MKLLFKNIVNNLRNNWITYGFETLVVVVGILGAFELENWKQTRQDRIKEQEYLSRIENDLKSDTIYYNRRIAEDEVEMDNLYMIVHEMYKTQNSLSDYQNLISMTTFPTEHLTIQNFTFLEMTNSGNLNLIKNETLKEEFIGYYNKAEMHGKHIKEYNEWSVQMFLKYLDVVHSTKNSSFGKNRIFDDPEMFKNEEWSFINNPSSKEFKILEGTYDAYHAKLFSINPYFIELKGYAKTILSMLHEEIH